MKCLGIASKSFGGGNSCDRKQNRRESIVGASLPTLGSARLFGYSHPHGCSAAFCCGSDLRFPCHGF